MEVHKKAKEHLNKFLDFKQWPKAVIVGLLFLIVVVIVFVAFGWWSENKIYPGLYLGSEHLGGKSRIEVENYFKDKVKQLNDGVPVECGDKKAVLTPISVSADGVVAIDLYRVNDTATWQEILDYGTDNSFWGKYFGLDKLFGLFYDRQLKWRVEARKEVLANYLQEMCREKEVKMVDADIYWQNNSWKILDEKIGKAFDYNLAADTIINNLINGSNESVVLKPEDVKPALTKEQINLALAGLEIKKPTSSLSLLYNDKKWTVDATNQAKWLSIKRVENGLVIDYNQDKISEYLKELIAKDINRQPEPPKFEIKDGKAAIFSQPVNGLELDLASSSLAISEALNISSSSVGLLVRETVEDNINNDAILNGIKELVGVGISDFSGSPTNRRHNIANGAQAINGLIIKPGEEFSLLKALGEIDSSTGYKQELVIKENKTIPEYGGGLCQVATTLFRAAVNSGLPITQRRNHSYRVAYYEPAGFDAAIYDPSPDLRFTNDTGNNLLLITKVGGNKATFELWGTKDGRKAEYEKPKVFNIVKPKPPKTIETDTLAPGQKKCTEKAHNGADAYFDYKVTYQDGTVKEKRFSSHYVPWQEVCLIGKTATSTSATIEEIKSENKN